ncbi:unnamed protein product [Protopolystoma xenopodis]|uniref:Uncharacterized protein n=1 Tax=Protopolystoma xenopodis TaxID=117903 RepID=A0A448X4H6_9PLAT|nr:unnamed protein product [Protopolystoma xenopodis]
MLPTASNNATAAINDDDDDDDDDDGINKKRRFLVVVSASDSVVSWSWRMGNYFVWPLLSCGSAHSFVIFPTAPPRPGLPTLICPRSDVNSVAARPLACVHSHPLPAAV